MPAVLAALDVPTLLLANHVGNDTRGAHVHEWLRRHHVATTAVAKADSVTPRGSFVVTDKAGTRTWFSHLPGVDDALS
jgi:sugar/nucleoside kinase (ribokinase family)